MIKRTLITAALLFIANNLLLAIPAVRSCFTVQSLWQDNIIRYQEYTLAPPPRCVLLGTSLSRGFKTEWLGDACYNLSATGGNVLLGLDVVLRNSAQPKIVLIETTRLMQDGAEGIVENTFRPVFHELRPLLPALRERYQPANLGGWLLGEHALRSTLSLLRIPVQTQTPTESVRDPSRFQQQLALNLQSHQSTHHPARLEIRCQKLQAALAQLRAQGIRPIIFELPLDSAVMNTPAVRQLDQALRIHFPDTRYEWIRPDHSRAHETTDGIHLTSVELKSYAEKIRAVLAPR